MKTKKDMLIEYPILSISTPATDKEKVELPGDCTSLYNAMRVLFQNIINDKKKHCYFNKCIPEIGNLPNKTQRKNISKNKQKVTIPDDVIFNPTIWNNSTKKDLENILKARDPSITYLGTLSQSHPYAIDIGQMIRDICPKSIIIMGGPHQDETLKYIPRQNKVKFTKFNTLKYIKEGHIPDVCDFIISGDGEFANSYLTKLISQKIDPQTKKIKNKTNLKEYVLKKAQEIKGIPGKSVIGFLYKKSLIGLPTSQTRYNLLDLPNIYKFFSLKIKNPIFKKGDGSSKLTAQMINLNGCPNSCVYCSEGSKVTGYKPLKDINLVDKSISKLLENISYGAEAIFFDDSIFFGGKKEFIMAFTKKLINLKEKDPEKLSNLEYAVQFTIEDLLKDSDKLKTDDLLKQLSKSGCSYIYLGIESLCDEVMKNVHKYKFTTNNGTYDNWYKKVDYVLTKCKNEGINVGASIQFGIKGETKKTISKTIDLVSKLIKERKLYLVSPNLSTYHPGTPMTKEDNMSNKLEFIRKSTIKKPYDHFEEANPNHISIYLDKDDINFIKNETKKKWAQAINTYMGEGK